MSKRVVKNYPSPRLMATIGATNQKPPEAIGELVANCFDARVDDVKMSILVDMRDNQITVIDNGRGMTDEVLEKAVCIAEDMSQHLERGASAKGHFGMGFKTSCSTLGGFYEIFTRPIGESIELYTSFDISDYSKRPAGANAWDVEIDSKPIDHTGPLGEKENGTAFVITKLKDKNITISAVLSYLGEAFKGHLETGDQIIVLDDTGSHPCQPKNYTFVPGTKIDIDTACGPNDSYRITGWMALDTHVNNSGNYGFNIYRHNQLVEKWDKSWFRSHLMTSRLIGEVSMDFLEATFYKQGVQQSEIWAIVTAHMTEYLKPIVSASQKISKSHNIDKPAERKKIVADLRESYEEDPYIEDDTETDTHHSSTEQKKPSVNETIKNVAKERSLLLADEGEIPITYIEKSEGGNVRAPFDYVYEDREDKGQELQVILFRDHPLWAKKSDADVVKVLATSDAIYRLLVEQIGISSSEALRIRNEWIWKRTGGEED